MGSSFGVYVHVPYCARKCPYCDFNVHVVRSVPEARYVESVVREIGAAAEHAPWSGRSVASVFFGGGTPSMFGADSIARIVDSLRDGFGLEDGGEIALEANPEDLCGPTGGSLAGALRSAGVNRLSIGGQSFDDRHLATLGRRHRGADVATSVEAARRAGFDNVSCDLIFAVPGQSLADWRRDLERLIELVPEHVSTYGLTYEPGTPMTAERSRGELEPVGEELERDMYELAISALGAAGYRHYEISNFALRGFESRHNLAYWSWHDYLGIGAGAHGFARLDAAREGAWGLRYQNVRAPERYMELAPYVADTSEMLTLEMAMSEFVLVGLRRRDGFAAADFARLFGHEIAEVSPALGELANRGMIEVSGGRVALTHAGLLLADEVTARLADVRV